MFAITGITGNVGGAVARTLLAAERPVRAVVRNARKGAEWAGRGCEAAVAGMDDAGALAAAFQRSGRRFRAGSAQLRSGAGLPGGTGYRGYVARRIREGASPEGCVPLDDRRTGFPIEPADAAHHHRAGAWRVIDADYFPAARVVHGELQLGRRRGARARRDSEFPATAN